MVRFKGVGMCFKKPKPDFEFNKKQIYNVSGTTLYHTLTNTFPEARIYMTDGNYKYMTFDELVRWLNTDSLDEMRWIEDIWDCDNFSVESYCRIHRYKTLDNIAYGESWGDTPAGFHAFNIAYIGTLAKGKLVIIEPQNDNTKDWKQSDFKPTFIKI